MNKKSNSRKSFEKGQDKDNRTQKSIVNQYLQEHIATASMVSVATGIPQKNITRYKRDLELLGRLWETEKKICKETGFKAWFLTTNLNMIPYSNQLKLF